MRKSDKKKNIAKANLLAEQRYLKSNSLVRESNLTVSEESLGELDKKTYASAAEKARAAGMSGLGDKFAAHGREHGTNVVGNISFDIDKWGTVVLSNITFTSDESFVGETEEGKKLVFHIFVKEISKTIITYLNGNNESYPSSVKDARDYLQLLNDNGVDTMGIRPKQITSGYVNELTEGYGDYDDDHHPYAPWNEPREPEPNEDFKMGVEDFPMGSNDIADLESVYIEFGDSSGSEYILNLLELVNGKPYNGRTFSVEGYLTPQMKQMAIKLLNLLNNSNNSEVESIVDDLLGSYLDANFSNNMSPIDEAQITEGNHGNPKYDLSVEENFNQLQQTLMGFLGKTRTNDSGMSNDNKVLLYTWLEQMYSPETMNYGQNGNEIYSNNPEQMEKFLSRKGISGKTIIPVR